MAAHTDVDALARIKEEATAKLAQLKADMAALNGRLDAEVMKGRFFLPPIPQVPEPIVDQAAHCKPLTSSAWSWADATRALIARKAYR